MWPDAGRKKPAIAFSKLVFPLPLGPKSAVTPCKGMFSLTFRSNPSNECDMLMERLEFDMRREPSIKQEDTEQRQEGYDQQDQGQRMGVSIV